MRALKIILISSLLVFIAGGLVGGYIIFLRPLTLPVYQLGQSPENGINSGAMTLAIGNQFYISGASEFALEMTNPPGNKSAMIGRTQDGMEVYPVPGQDPDSYLMLTTLMFPDTIFRNANIPPIQLASFPVDEVQLLENQMPNAPVYSTSEDAIRSEVVGRLLQRQGITKNAAPLRTVFLRLVSRQLPGLGYLVYAAETSGGSVFLADKLAPDDWIPAGEAFTNWYQQLPLQPAR
jgi:hypothetical protein